jgi:uncharacterized membrane protein YdbT with pleckstrin-like domain
MMDMTQILASVFLDIMISIIIAGATYGYSQYKQNAYKKAVDTLLANAKIYEKNHYILQQDILALKKQIDIYKSNDLFNSTKIRELKLEQEKLREAMKLLTLYVREKHK